ncbi:HbrB-domain-containing protein [Basidiobolus meristosporus CBS 931.73]|uniref:HbrB-domain-containing protein n=1 Tax=Basidiobolus meristosporus CBS 931.73 TaxID=1314790 RepID=A0A1Y1Y6K0_9FUNG|nr:HbrB-domain-containing protein [Basidiobolus meristosporus CBS 931.73]|eukprot:ORX93589.1 HbrB-domain-containing protein [Basidiobolus meristosporus CBS 931.73]
MASADSPSSINLTSASTTPSSTPNSFSHLSLEGSTLTSTHPYLPTSNAATHPTPPTYPTQTSLPMAALQNRSHFASPSAFVLASSPPQTTNLPNMSTTSLAMSSSLAISKSLMSLDARTMSREMSLSGDAYVQDDKWQTLCVKVLPLFNGEGLKGYVEDLNELVRGCLNDKALATLAEDIEHLLGDGMLTLNVKLIGVNDEKLVSRLVELWSFFFGTVLPYFESVFLPLQTEVKKYQLPTVTVNVRNMALSSFRDHVIIPMVDRLEGVFSKLFIDNEETGIPRTDTAARMLQMISVLSNLRPDDDFEEDIKRVLDMLKTNYRAYMSKRDHRWGTSKNIIPDRSEEKGVL